MNDNKKNSSLENVIVKPMKDYKVVGEVTKTKKKRQNKKQNKNKRKRDKILKNIIIFLIVIVIILVIISIFLIKSEKLEIYIGNSKLKYSTNNGFNGVYITDVSKVVDNAMPSIVSVTAKNSRDYNPSDNTNGAASGIIIGKSNKELMILTNNHVISNASQISVGFINGKSYDAQIKGVSTKNDIAVLSVELTKIDKTTLKAIKVATTGYSKDLKVGTGVIAIGNALGYGQSVTTGIISAIDKEVVMDDNTYKMIQIDASINSGNSGGALLNSKGEVIGINSFKYSSNSDKSYSDVEGVAFAIPISDVSNVIKELMSGKDENNGLDLGIEGYIINEENSSFYNMPRGFYISKITSDSIAAKSELKVGNIIVEADNNKVLKYDDLLEVLSNKQRKDKVKFKIMYLNDNKYMEKIVEISI